MWSIYTSKGGAITNISKFLLDSKDIKKKILKDQSIPGCKKTETEEESTVTYITKKKKSEEKKKEKKLITKKKEKKKKKVEKYVPEDIKEDNIKPKIEIANSFTFNDPEYLLKGKLLNQYL